MTPYVPEWQKEQQVHKWLTKTEAKRIVRDHRAKKNKTRRKKK